MKKLGPGGASLMTLATLLVASPLASARDHATARATPVLQWVGYRILVEPEVVEPQRGRLMTRALLWKFRAVFRNDRTGADVYVLTNLRGTNDTRVRVKRPWVPSDKPRVSRLFKNETKAIRRFSELKKSSTTALLMGAPKAPPPPPPPPPPSCTEVMTDKGHSRHHLSRCKGVDRHCAVALLLAGHSPVHLHRCRDALDPGCVSALMRNGHSPIHLDACKGVDPHCAVSLLENKGSTIHLRKCRAKDLSRRCITALFNNGRSAMHIERCRGVDGRCAARLLKTRSPIHLQQCVP